MTSIKKILFAGLLLLIAPFITKANVSPTKEFYVNDYANVLTNETKNNIIELNKKLYEKTGAQLVVVTLNSLDGDSVENVANTIFNDFEIGSKNDNGLLILFAKEDRKIRVEVGYGLEETLNDGKVGRMIDEYMIPYLRNDHFDEGIANGFNAFFNYLLNYYGISDIDLQSVSTDETSDEPTTAEIIFIIIFIIIIIYVSIKNDFGGGYYGGGFYGGGHSGGHFSGGGSFGGGGHSGGGGASRGF